MSIFILDFLIAYIVDLIFGDPYILPHPVRMIGYIIVKFEGIFLKGRKKSPKIEFLLGILMAILAICIVCGIIIITLNILGKINIILMHIFNIYIIYTSFATKCLAFEANKMVRILRMDDINKARKDLSMLVGRETSKLDKEQITKGVIETTAENTVDGVVSPMFYAILGSLIGYGAIVVYFFKVVSTLDSMVGYRNDKYENFGKFAARLDDVLNFIPARITAVLIIISVYILKYDYKNSFKILLRDRLNHKSPNCAYPEAAVAGGLNIQLGGDNIYFGRIVKKPTIGDSNKEIEVDDISKTINIMYLSSFIFILFICCIGGLYVSWRRYL